MKIEQFEDKGLAHYSYAILSEQANQVVLIDPSRNLAPYVAFAEKHGAAITAVIETHPHADFVSGHLELHKTKGATIYCSNLLGASYPHKPFDEGDTITLGEIKFKALNTPGHSPDSISIVLQHNDVDHAVFTGDTLFIGDCGRPDLRENVGQFTATREELASQMYTSLRDKLMVLGSDVLVYPAHGAGSLCGKGLSQANYSTISAEKTSNWSLRNMNKADFIAALLEDQPFIPKYFPFDVELNKNGAPNLAEALQAVSVGNTDRLNENILVIDTRPEAAFKKGHLPNAINLQNGEKFETWLGSIVTPGEAFYLLASNETELKNLILRCAKIGYETFIEQAFVYSHGPMTNSLLDIEHFKTHTADYTIVDIRNDGEVKAQPVFENAITIPLPELRERVNEIPLNKPIVVHCAGGYRSAAGSSIVANTVGAKTMVYDLSEAIKAFI